MNVRIDEDSIRFRIIPDDLASLLDGKEIEQHVIGFTCRITSGLPGKEMDLQMAENGFTLSVSRAILEQLRDMGRSKEGISIQKSDIEISLQVDLKAQSGKAA